MVDNVIRKVDGVPVAVIQATEVETEVTTGVCTPKDIWDNKTEWFEAAKQSREYWSNKMTDEQRKAVLTIVQGAIARMYDRTEEWVPEAIELSGGQFIEVNFRILFTDIDKEIERQESATSFEIAEATQGTKSLLDELLAD